MKINPAVFKSDRNHISGCS